MSWVDSARGLMPLHDGWRVHATVDAFGCPRRAHQSRSPTDETSGKPFHHFLSFSHSLMQLILPNSTLCSEFRVVVLSHATRGGLRQRLLCWREFFVISVRVNECRRAGAIIDAGQHYSQRASLKRTAEPVHKAHTSTGGRRAVSIVLNLQVSTVVLPINPTTHFYNGWL